MYNEERKQQFLLEKRKDAIISNNIENCFQSSEAKEEYYGRDICDWNTSEILDFYRWMSTPFVQTLILVNSSLTEYTSWCLVNGLVKDNQNHFYEINSTMLCECVDTNKLKEMVFSKKEIMEIVSQLPNYVDRFIILGLFEGIPHLALGDVKISDFDNNCLHLSDGSERYVSDDLLRIASFANDQDEYISMGQTNRVCKFEPADTIIKPKITRRGIQRNHSLIIGETVRRCARYLGLHQNTRITTIKESGRLNFFKEKALQDGIPLDRAMELYRKESEAIYGKIQNMVTYINTYGKLEDI